MPGHIPWTQVDRTLAATRSIWLATTRPSGRPHAVPVWFYWDGEAVYFVSGNTSQKNKNLAAQPYIVVHVGDGDDVIVLEGVAETVNDEQERSRIDRLYGDKYVDPHSGAKASVLAATDTLFRVRVSRVMTWEYGVVDTRTDWYPKPAATPS